MSSAEQTQSNADSARGMVEPASMTRCPDPTNETGDHYPQDPSDWGDFDTPKGGCVQCGISPYAPKPTLAEFLLARVAEDEAAARRAIEPEHMYPWGDTSLPALTPEQMPGELRGYLGGPWGEHAARWASLRVLAECEAKRRIVDLCSDRVSHSAVGGRGCTECGVLAALALPYADHRDYRPEFAP